MLAPLAALILLTAISCGTRRTDQQAAVEAGEGEPKPVMKAAAASGSNPAPRRVARSAGTNADRREAPTARRTHVVRLTAAGCVQFEPQWMSIRVGQSLTWQSDLPTPVTLHVSPGAFDRTEYVVAPGGSVSTGPALAAGSFEIGSEPRSCQVAPLGVRGSGPGVTVEEDPGH